MFTIYNVELSICETADSATLAVTDLRSRTIDTFLSYGLLGKKHVTHVGKVLRGYDSSCDTYDIGHFELVLRNAPEFEGKTLREALDYKKLTTSGFNASEQRRFELGDSVLNELEQTDSFVKTPPMDIYSQLPYKESLSINTPMGKQDAHIHYRDDHNDDDVIQLWKPLDGKRWYDLDVLKGSLQIVYKDYGVPNSFQKWRMEKAQKLYFKLVKDPDSVIKRDLFVLNFIWNKTKVYDIL